MKAVVAVVLLLSVGNKVEYFPSILFGHILIGPGMSRYETIFVVTAKEKTRSRLTLFSDRGEAMKARFVDEEGNVASVGSAFEIFLVPGRPVKIKLALPPDESSDDVAVRTGWATFTSSGEIEVSALVRITTPDGKLITKHVLGSQRPPAGD